MCDERTHSLILLYLAGARGRVLDRSHFLISHRVRVLQLFVVDADR